MIETTLLLPTELKDLDKIPAPFYTFDQHGNYIFIHAEDWTQAARWAKQNYYDYPIKSSLLGHKGEQQ